MKVGIITLTVGANYGNRLQNYALQQLLTSLGCEVETIQRKTYRSKTTYEKIVWFIKDVIKYCIGRNGTKCLCQQRFFAFEKFNRNYIKYSDYILSDNIAPSNISKNYDFFVCGSDQIWNTHFPDVRDDLLNNLAFFANSSQRIAYAASFGTDKVDDEFAEVFSRELNEFKALGIREKSGIEIVRTLTGRNDAHLVLDPTLMIDRSEWKSVEKKPGFVKKDEEYLVTYFIGGRTDKITNHISKIADECELRVINLEMEFVTDRLVKDRKAFMTTPDEFLWLIDHARYVITDSFHASAFSIIFKKEFLVYSRRTKDENDMNGRIETLLSIFNIEKCWDDIDNPSHFPPFINYTYIEPILGKKREESRRFLTDALTEFQVK